MNSFINLTLVSALIRQHKAAVFTLRLDIREPLFNFPEAEIFFEEGVTVQDGQGESYISELFTHSKLQFTMS